MYHLGDGFATRPSPRPLLRTSAAMFSVEWLEIWKESLAEIILSVIHDQVSTIKEHAYEWI